MLPKLRINQVGFSPQDRLGLSTDDGWNLLTALLGMPGIGGWPCRMAVISLGNILRFAISNQARKTCRFRSRAQRTSTADQPRERRSQTTDRGHLQFLPATKAFAPFHFARNRPVAEP